MAASRRNVFAVLALLIVMGCQPSDPTARGPSQPVAQAAPLSTVPTEREPDGMPKRYSVVPYGYNYTDTDLAPAFPDRAHTQCSAGCPG